MSTIDNNFHSSMKIGNEEFKEWYSSKNFTSVTDIDFVVTVGTWAGSRQATDAYIFKKLLQLSAI